MLKAGHYCISAENILCHEMIGLEAKARISGETGGARGSPASGRVVWETKNTFTIEDGKGVERMVPKKGNVFEFELGNEVARVEGSRILYRPEHRAKALLGCR